MTNNIKIPDYFSPPNFLPINMVTFSTKNFANYDSPDRFKKNLKRQPPDWKYRSKKIVYNVNSNGYRAPEWKDVDWKNSIVVFGCSNVAGIGLADDETISYQLEKMIGRPVINFGAPASSIEFSFYNSVILSHYYPTPWAVIQIWTNIERCVYFEKKLIKHHGVWSKKHAAFQRHNKFLENALVKAKMFSMASCSLWKNTKYFQSSFFEDTSRYLECPWVEIDNKARDLLHPGKGSANQMAELIFKNLNT